MRMERFYLSVDIEGLLYVRDVFFKERIRLGMVVFYCLVGKIGGV